MPLPVEDKPHQAAEKKNNGGIKQRNGLDRRLKLTPQQVHAQERSNNNRYCKADHPHRKERSYNVDRRRSPASRA